MTKLLELPELCTLLEINWRRLELLVKEGALPKSKRLGNQLGWDPEEVLLSSFVVEPKKWTSDFTLRYGPRRVYFIASGEFVKIGYSAEIKYRMLTMQTDNPHRLELLHEIRGDMTTEEWYHWKFEKHHYRGEWFHKHKDILDFIERHKNDPDAVP